MLGSGKSSLISRLKPRSKRPAAAAGVGENETPLLDKRLEVLLGLLRKLGGLVPVEEHDRGLKHLLNRGGPRVDNLPGEKVFPVFRDDRYDVANVVGVVVPVLAPRMDAAC